jgi:hypothetical protein
MTSNELYINQTLVDLGDELPISLNYAIADLTNPDKRNAAFSKTIKIPGTKTNNQVFGFIFDISKLVAGVSSSRYSFNPNKKADCLWLSDSLKIFKGYAQLLEVNEIDEQTVEYEICIYGTLASIFNEIEGLKLTDLDFSEFDHLYTKAFQRETWATRIQKNGANYVNFAAGNPTGEGYVYPLIDYGNRQIQTEFEVKRLYPAIYVKQYLDKIFGRAGFTYSSDFFDSTFFKRLIIPFNGELVPLTQAEKDSRRFDAEFSADTTFNNIGPSFTDLPVLIFPNEISDPSFSYNPATGEYTVIKKGSYNFKANVDYSVVTNDGATLTRRFDLFIDLYDQSGVVVATVQDTHHNPSSDISGNMPLSLGIRELQVGQKIKLRVSFTSATSNDYDLIIHAGSSITNEPVSTPIIEGDTMQVNSAIPKDVLMKDFFKSIITLFNLYVDIDPNNEKNLIIEPLIDFYSGNTVVDWTSKLDLSKEISIRPVSQIEGKNYIFSYKEDKDYYNADYKSRWETIYGQKNIEIDNDFVKGQKKFEVIFAPTPSVGNSSNSMAVPRIVKRNEDGTVSPITSVVRILYYGGVIDAGGTWKYISNINTSETPFPSALSPEYYYTLETEYPYAGHLDDPYNPTLDLNWDVPNEIYWGTAGNIGLAYTNNNLFNKYYKQFIEEITDKDSKIVTAYFKLSAVDIFKLSFKNFIHVRGMNYRLNKVLDYDPTTRDLDKTTKVELSKIKQGIPFTPSTVGVDGTGNDLKKFSLLEGGLNEVRRITATNPQLIVEGGEDEVRDMSATNTEFILDGGCD